MKTMALLFVLLVLSGCDEDAINSFNQSNQPQESSKVDGQAIEPTTDMSAGYGFPVIVFDEEIVLGGDFGEQTARLLATKTLAGTKVELFVPKLEHASKSSPTSQDPLRNVGLKPIPVTLRPSAGVSNVYSISSAGIKRLFVNNSGDMTFVYKNWYGVNFHDITTGVAGYAAWYIPN